MQKQIMKLKNHKNINYFVKHVKQYCIKLVRIKIKIRVLLSVILIVDILIKIMVMSHVLVIYNIMMQKMIVF